MENKEDLLICNTCMNRIYNAKNDLYCGKNLDNKEIQFYCAEFCSEETYNKKLFFLKEDKTEYSYKKVLSVFIWLTIIQLASLYRLINLEFIDLTMSLIGVLFTFISIGIFLAIYFGKRWARIVTNIIYSLSLLSESVKLGSNVDDISEILTNLLSVVVTAYILYFINADKDFVKHFNQRHKSN